MFKQIISTNKMFFLYFYQYLFFILSQFFISKTMKIKSKNQLPKFAFNKCNRNQNAPLSTKNLSFMRFSDNSQVHLNGLSFDSFFYKDHVTLKKYSCQNLKKHNTQRINTQSTSDQKWRQNQNIKMINLMEYIDVWKSIKQNRNNILVYGKKKSTRQKNQTSRQNTGKQTVQIDQSMRKELKKSRQVTFKQETKIFSQRQRNIYQSRKIISQRSSVRIQNINNNPIQFSEIKCQQIGKLKRKLNQKIYKMNKVLLRQYLKDQTAYDESFNYLIKNEDSLESKMKKMQLLINKLEHNQNFKENSKCQLYHSGRHTVKNVSSKGQLYEKTQKQIKQSIIGQNADQSTANDKQNQNNFNIQNDNENIQLINDASPNTYQNSSEQKNRKQKSSLTVRKSRTSIKELKSKPKKFFLGLEQPKSKFDLQFQQQQNSLSSQISRKYWREVQFLINKNKKHNINNFK